MALLDGKVVAITGAGRGIGRGEALYFAKHGAKVVVNDLGAGPAGEGEARSDVAEKVVAEIKAAGGKAGIAAFTITVAFDMARYGVTCNAIAPSAHTRLINTVMRLPNVSETPDEPEGFEPMHPHNIAPLIVYLASDDAQWISGQVFD